MDYKTTGSIIKQKRIDLGLTQKQLADLVNVSDKAISKWENDEGLPDIENLKRLSTIFKLSIDELVLHEPLDKQDVRDIPLIGLQVGVIILFLFPFFNITSGSSQMSFNLGVTGIELIASALSTLNFFDILIGVMLLVLLLVTVYQIYHAFIKTKVEKLLTPSKIALVLAILLTLVIIGVRFLLVERYIKLSFTPFLLVLIEYISYRRISDL